MLRAVLLAVLGLGIILQQAMEHLFLGFGWLCHSGVPGLEVRLENLRPALRIKVLHTLALRENFDEFPPILQVIYPRIKLKKKPHRHRMSAG
jgi:hypothetical protein